MTITYSKIDLYLYVVTFSKK